MSFDSLSAFVSMGGHGLYVWMAYGVTLVVLLTNLVWPARVRAGFVRAEKRVQSRQAERKTEKEAS
ncbi:MAG: heme exporter protein CcmD [Gammaproteobacteria bacterium]|jgi:heme exporter protein D|nr:heme exporter protein CcmD [Gammaproteobacteria bacterium]MBT4492707.1 heme exporter protein CcmD [Gammaproteobacteria bacterium]MBT7369846.1 heme exporter protein CcmD [Gammaproteobacteria bacterium]